MAACASNAPNEIQPSPIFIPTRIPYIMTAKKLPQSIDSRILARVHWLRRGSVFVSAVFLALGSQEAIDFALHRLARKGMIRRLARGVYDFPKEHPVDLQPGRGMEELFGSSWANYGQAKPGTFRLVPSASDR
jgi:hypothetical protein